MRLLFLTPDLPSPVHSGARRRREGLLSRLAERHEVSVLALAPAGVDISEDLAASRAYCARAIAVPNDRFGQSQAGKRRLQLRSLASPRSFEVLAYQRPAYQAALDDLLGRERFDVVTFEFAQMGGYRLPPMPGTPVLLDEHNIEYEVHQRTAAAEVSHGRRLYSRLNGRKLRREEEALWRRVDGCTVASARDAAIVRRAAPDVRTAVIPNGVDTSFFAPSAREPEPLTMLFFGAVHYYPNTHGLRFFLDRVLPRIRARQPEARLLIVGENPPPEIAGYQSEHVRITGLVDDVRLYLERAAVVVVPLLIGSGTRLKVVESMAMAKAIVSTRIGAEGIDVVDGRDILLADEAGEFADRVCRLLEDRPLARRLGRAARRLAVDRYDWRHSVRALEEFYAGLGVAQPAAAASRVTVGLGTTDD